MPYEAVNERMDRLETALATFIRQSTEQNGVLTTKLAEVATQSDSRMADLDAKLAEVAAQSDRRMANLDAKLAESNARSERSSTKLDAKLAEVAAESERSRATLDAKLAELATQSDRRMANLDAKLAESNARSDRDIAEMRQWRIDSQKRWGEIAQKIGTFVEDIVAPNIPRIGEEVFKIGSGADVLFSAPRVRMRHPADSSRMREYDYIYATKNGWIVVESKNEGKLKDIDDFRETIADAKEFYPQYAAKPLYPIFASLYVPDHVVAYCTRHGIYALGMGPETMQLFNAGDLPTSK